MEVKRVSETKASEAQSVLGWGAAGSGKTVFGGSAGDDSLFINNGGGAETLRSKWFRETYKTNPFIVDIPIDSPNTKLRSMDLVEQAIQFGLTSPDINTITLDDSTTFRMSSMIRAMEYNLDENKSKTLTAAKKNDFVLPVVQDYGTEMELTRQFLAYYIVECKAVNKNFIILAHERKIFSSPKKIGEPPIHIKDVPSFTGADKNPDAVAGMFDWVLYFQAIGGGDHIKYRATTEGDETLLAKSRHKNLLPVKWDNPNFKTLIQKVKESR